MPTEQIPCGLRWIQYVCSLKYGINLIMINEFGPDTQQARDWPAALLPVCILLTTVVHSQMWRNVEQNHRHDTRGCQTCCHKVAAWATWLDLSDIVRCAPSIVQYGKLQSSYVSCFAAHANAWTGYFVSVFSYKRTKCSATPPEKRKKRN